MKTINTCGALTYSLLIPAIIAMCETPKGESLEIVMNNAAAFSDLKAYLAEQGIGFREIYEGDSMSVQFTR